MSQPPSNIPGVQPVLLETVHQSVIQLANDLFGSTLVYQPNLSPPGRGDSICGTISFAGSPTWSLMAGCGRETACLIAEKFTGMEIDFDSPDMGDTVGEFVNILAGYIVAGLEEHGLTAAMSLPVIVRGYDIERILPRSVASSHLVFESGSGPFWLQLVEGHPGNGMPSTTHYGDCAVWLK